MGNASFFLTCSVPNVIGNLGWKVFLDYFLVGVLSHGKKDGDCVRGSFSMPIIWPL